MWGKRPMHLLRDFLVSSYQPLDIRLSTLADRLGVGVTLAVIGAVDWQLHVLPWDHYGSMILTVIGALNLISVHFDLIEDAWITYRAAAIFTAAGLDVED